MIKIIKAEIKHAALIAEIGEKTFWKLPRIQKFWILKSRLVTWVKILNWDFCKKTTVFLHISSFLI